jgi:hypothetical protein
MLWMFIIITELIYTVLLVTAERVMCTADEGAILLQYVDNLLPEFMALYSRTDIFIFA